MQTVTEQINNFLGGNTSELRANYQVPKFARLWNFDVSVSRAVQHYGLEEVLSGKYHVVEYEPSNVTSNNQWFLNRHSVLLVRQDGQATLVDTSPGFSSQTILLGSDVEMATLPVIYNDHIVWLDSDWDVWVKPLNPSGAAFQVLTSLTANEANVRHTFFQQAADGKLYIVSGKRVHRIELPDSDGKFNSYNDLAKYQPITQYMEEGDREGNVGTYTGFLGPETQIITDISKAQNILRVLGYYTSSVDGVFGPATAAAVSAFQSDYNATGNVPGGQSAGQALAVDGIIGPETQAVLNATDSYSKLTIRERKNVLVLPDNVTAVCNNGGVINLATHRSDGYAEVFYWDKSLTSEGVGDIGLLTSVTVAKGVVQVLRPLDGRLIAITSPATDSFEVSKYVNMSVYSLQGSFELIPESYSTPIAEYRLRVGPDGSVFDDWRFNFINQKSTEHNSRIYFSGQINFQHIQEPNNGEGVFAGVMSIDSRGNLFMEAAVSNSSDDLTNVPIHSFGMIDSGFVIATEDGVHITSKEETNNVSGFITDIINGGVPSRKKKLDNIFITIHDWSNIDHIEIYVREVDNVNENDARWELAYTGGRQDSNTVVINKLENDEAFFRFKELQVMGKIFGIGGELVNITIEYKVPDSNK